MTCECLPGNVPGETPVHSNSVRANTLARAMYFVAADADPALPSRLIEPFAKLGLTPDRVHISREDGAGDALSADLRVTGIDAVTAHLVDMMLRRVIGVRSVIAVVE